jgi:hypothetical protein
MIVGQETAISLLRGYGWSLTFVQPLIWGISNKSLMIVSKLSGQKFKHGNNVGRRRSYLHKRRCVGWSRFMSGRLNGGKIRLAAALMETVASFTVLQHM